ncbi:Uncharacterized protein conserved in bacteria (DUF2086) [Pseudomonas luteola]|uniref:Uncharacterized protein conserved in bacteria (DUF2086) n=1 Tax=Pseudomonas luteola TaxID=47886 RepID=A0A2X2C9R5_PSELU|nr:2OG-Fe(II) oxygenase [Pseudomonas luteola]MCG7374143.1 2OG-Fe(II) oxygenase [Pseudomonas luteola]SPZ04867.1 Uncharacterized protein conserved in bacteria (DUF2086) [Pseudomonas luteola]
MYQPSLDLKIIDKNPLTHRSADCNLFKHGTDNYSFIETKLVNDGYFVIENVISLDQCRNLIRLFDSNSLYRRCIDMETHAYGRGKYKYFRYPLPTLVHKLRTDFYEMLAPHANKLQHEYRNDYKYPDKHSEFLKTCAKAGQNRPTPLLLKYLKNDYCCLHQDIYGEHKFPFQVIIMLNQPEVDFIGGEIVLVESSRKHPERAHSIFLKQGDSLVLATNKKPHFVNRGATSNLKHGVSRVITGTRHTLGLIFHDSV